jgi:hypothetical protein
MRPAMGMHLEAAKRMAQATTGSGRLTASLSEEQWHELMRSLIDEPDAPGDEASENSLLQDVAGRDHATAAQPQD